MINAFDVIVNLCNTVDHNFDLIHSILIKQTK